MLLEWRKSKTLSNTPRNLPVPVPVPVLSQSLESSPTDVISYYYYLLCFHYCKGAKLEEGGLLLSYLPSPLTHSSYLIFIRGVQWRELLFSFGVFFFFPLLLSSRHVVCRTRNQNDSFSFIFILYNLISITVMKLS